MTTTENVTATATRVDECPRCRRLLSYCRASDCAGAYVDSHDRLTEALAPALDVFGEELALHMYASATEVMARYSRFGPVAYVGTCACGWTGRRASHDRGTANRSAGLHRSAAEKRASKAYDAAADAVIAGLR